MKRTYFIKRNNDSIPKRPEWGQSNYKDVVRQKFQFVESLPLPIVTYPRIYGTWIVFQEAEGTQPFLCSCQKLAALNFVRLNEHSRLSDRSKRSNVLKYFFQGSVAVHNKLEATTLDEFSVVPIFRDGLCHICNRHVPPIRWSNLDEHSAFLQHFGWYFHHALLAAGISPHGNLLIDSLDAELKALVEIDPEIAWQRIRESRKKHLDAGSLVNLEPRHLTVTIPDSDEIRDHYAVMKRQSEKIQRLVEERLRHSLGFPPRTKTGVSERLLYWIVASLFPKFEIRFHARPSFLQGLELDIFVPELHLAIEYQGEQHYEPFEHLGGDKHLRSVKKRDKKKAAACKSEGIELLYFTVSDILTEEHVRTMLKSYVQLKTQPIATETMTESENQTR
jgi:hypothetical protein